MVTEWHIIREVKHEEGIYRDTEWHQHTGGMAEGYGKAALLTPRIGHLSFQVMNTWEVGLV